MSAVENKFGESDGRPVGRLRPHPIQYFGMAFVPVILVAVAVVSYQKSPTGSLLIAAGFLIAFSLYFAVRWFGFAGARKDKDDLVVTGPLWSRRIPLAHVDRVSFGYVAVTWHTRRGKRRWTPITPLWSKPRPLEVVTRHSNNKVMTIRSWVECEKTARSSNDE